jgi:hypothetical protein
MRQENLKSDPHWQRLLERLKTAAWRKIDDPHAYRTVPVRRPPRGRSGAAVVELDQE